MNNENYGLMRFTGTIIVSPPLDKNKFFFVLNKIDEKWSLPTGKINPFEHPSDGAVREVLEEIGFTVVVKQLVGIWPFTSPKGNSIINIVYSGEVIEGIPKVDSKESISKIDIFSLREVRDLHKKGKLRGSASLRFLEEYCAGRVWPVDQIIKPTLVD
ncbi:MAG: NUDIX domain-containing protein [Nanoarchaeota archaeon]|nr:NUDIX domain-containing protein [Nanoarchaeota archaeon]